MEEEPPLRDREREIMMMDCFYIHETYKTKKSLCSLNTQKSVCKHTRKYKRSKKYFVIPSIRFNFDKRKEKGGTTTGQAITFCTFLKFLQSISEQKRLLSKT